MIENSKNIVGNKLEFLLDYYDLTVKKVADKIGCSEKTIYRYLNGEEEPNRYNFTELVNLFDIPMEFFLGGESYDNIKIKYNGRYDELLKQYEQYITEVKNDDTSLQSGKPSSYRTSTTNKQQETVKKLFTALRNENRKAMRMYGVDIFKHKNDYMDPLLELAIVVLPFIWFEKEKLKKLSTYIKSQGRIATNNIIGYTFEDDGTTNWGIMLQLQFHLNLRQYEQIRIIAEEILESSTVVNHRVCSYIIVLGYNEMKEYLEMLDQIENSRSGK